MCVLVVLMVLVSVPSDSQVNDSERDTVYAVSPVIVTATTAVERLSPVTFSNLTKVQIQQRYSGQDVPVLLSELPSITTYSENGSGIGYNYINLRGFDQRRISVMINGVPQNDPEDHNVYWIDFPDLLASTQDIQVQRGAGSAFYGPAAIGGSVNMTTNPFEFRPSIVLDAQAGFQELSGEKRLPMATRRVSLSVNSGLVAGRYMLNARLGRIENDGYRENGWVKLNSYFLGAIRVDPTMTTRVHVYGGPISDGLAYVGLPKSYNSSSPLRRLNYSYWEYDSTGTAVGFAVPQKPEARESFAQPHVEVMHDWHLSPRSTLRTTVFVIAGDGYFDYDGDWIPYDPSAASWFRQHLGYGPSFGPQSSQVYSFIIRGAVKNRQWGILPVWETAHENGTFTLGAELRVHRSLHDGRFQYASAYPSPSFDPATKIYEYRGLRDIVSVYARETFSITETMTLLGEVQGAYHRYGIYGERYLGHEFTTSYWFVNPRGGVNVNLSEIWNVYGYLGMTTREPRMRNLYAAEDAFFGATPQFEADTTGGIVRYDFSRPFAKPERLIDLEVGSSWRGVGWMLSANLYWMEFGNELVKSGRVDIFGQPVTGNAQRSRHLGLELEGSARLADALTVSGNATWSHNRLIRYRTFEGGNATILDGNPVAGFPAFLANLRVSGDVEDFHCALSLKHVGLFATDNSGLPGRHNDAFTVVNLELLHGVSLLNSVEMTIRGEVRNVLNLLYTMSGEGESFFPAAERNYVIGCSVKL